MESVQLVLISTCVVMMFLAVREVRGVPLKNLYNPSGPKSITKKFFLFIGISFIPLIILSLIGGDYILAVLLGILTVIEFWQYRLAVNGNE